MKTHRFYLTGTGPTADFIIRIPNASVYDGQLFVEMLAIDTSTDTTNEINSFLVKSKTLSDKSSYNSQTSNFNTIAQFANTDTVNSSKDFRINQLIDSTSVGYPIKIADLSNYSFNINIQQDNNVDINGAWTWAIRLLIIDGQKPNKLVEYDKNQANYFGKIPVREILPYN